MFGAFPPTAYPRPYRLGEALRKKRDVSTLLKRYVDDLTSTQQNAALSALTDGRLLWDNAVEGSASLLDGWEKGDLTRFFDNNYFYRRPIKNALKPSNRLALELRFMPYLNRVFPVMGPLSFSWLASGRYEIDFEYAKALASALSGYEGYLVIQEPSLLTANSVNGLREQLAESISLFPSTAKKILMTYFAPFSRLYSAMLDLPVDGLWLDCVSDPSWDATPSEYGGKRITVLGLIDARNTKLERAEEVAARVRNVTLSGEVYVAPNWGFDIIPYPVSKTKTEALGRIKKILEAS